MARKLNNEKVLKHKMTKEFEVVESDAKDAPVKDVHWHGREMDVESDTKLEDDKGYGETIVIRTFTFGINPEAFKNHKPTSQDIFNSHVKGIEVMLWKDGLTFFQEVSPRVVFSKDKKFYQIFVGAKAARGQMFSYKDTPQTLSKLLHATPGHSN